MTLPARRQLLVSITWFAFVIATGVVLWMFGVSLQPTEATVISHQKEVDVSTISVGAVLRVEWEGFDVFVLRRTPTQIAWLESHTPPALGSHTVDDVPTERLKNRYRSFSQDFLVVAVWKNGNQWRINENRSLMYACDDFGYSPEPIRVSEETTFPGGFYCASMKLFGRNDYIGSPGVFDPAGRTQSPWYQPLSVPRHLFKGNILVLGVQG